MQDQPMVRMAAEGLGRVLFQFLLDGQHRFAGCQAGAVANAKDVRVDSESLCPKGAVHDDIGRLSSYARQRLQQFPIRRNFAFILVDEYLAQRDDVLRLRSEEHTSELQSLMRISYAVFCLQKKT